MGVFYGESIVFCVKGVDLYVIVDLVLGNVEVFVKKFGLNIKVFINLLDMLEYLDIDVVIIVLLVRMYVVNIIVVVKKGKVVFCEKLMVVMLEEVDEVIRVVNEEFVLF